MSHEPEGQVVLEGGESHTPPPHVTRPQYAPDYTQPPRGNGHHQGPPGHPGMDPPPHLDPFAVSADGGPDPMDFLGVPNDTRVVRISRVKCEGEESDETGFMGVVARTLGFEEEVGRRWGGGDYTAVAIKNGRPIERCFTLGGDSKPRQRSRDDEDGDE